VCAIAVCAVRVRVLRLPSDQEPGCAKRHLLVTLLHSVVTFMKQLESPQNRDALGA